MDRDAAQAGLSGVDAGLAALGMIPSFLGAQVGLPPDIPNLDTCQPAGIVESVPTPDWVLDAAELRQERLIEEGNEAQALPDVDYADHAPPVDPGVGDAGGGIF